MWDQICMAIVYQARPFLTLVFYMRGEGLARYTNLAITQHTCIKTMQLGDCICMKKIITLA